MIVSKLNWQYIFGIDLSDQGAVIFTISNEDLERLKNGEIDFVDGEIIPIEPPEVEVPEKTPEQIAYELEMEKRYQILTLYPIEKQLSILRKALGDVSTDEDLLLMIEEINEIQNS